MLQYPCYTKTFMMENRKNEGVKELFELSFNKRPEEELYDLAKDPFQMKNVAYEKNYIETKEMLSVKLTNYLKEQGDPRELGTEMKWKGAPYYAEKDKTPQPSEESQKMFNLEEEYSYIED
jgi:N-sulfoglucosamine sulfohydrolase